MKLRRIVSLVSLLSFLLVIVTSVVLYIVPEGRVAYWADWTLWGMSKTQWTDVHLNLGVLFLIAFGFHLYFNWNPLATYMKNAARQLVILTREFNVALVLTVVVVAGTLLGVPPFSSVIELSESFKDAAAVTYGEPPYGHAELSSLKTFAKQVGLDIDKGMAALEAAGIVFRDADQTLKEIAKANNVAPRRIHDIMRPAAQMAEPGAAMPEAAPPGTGNRPLADICAEYGLHFPSVQRHLADRGVQSSADMTLKAIADGAGMGPTDVYQLVREAAQQEK